jgi:nucleoside-diphosphate-sugar epimerase
MPKQQSITKSALIPTVLISGGAGFIGSHLAEYLLHNKARVVVLDNFKTGKEVHVKHLLSNPNFALYDVDINEGLPADIQSVDYIFHLAGLEEYFYSKDYLSLESLLTNSLGTKNLLDLAKRSSAKFLLGSTIDVYQIRTAQVDLAQYFGSNVSEENRFSLLEAKRFAEAIVWEYFKKHNIDARIVRLPEVYGPRMDLNSSGFLGGYIKNVLEGTSIDVYGDGEEKGYYLYISDVISGIIKAQFNENTKGNIYSIVPKGLSSSLETAYLVKSIADSKMSVQFKPSIGNRNFNYEGISNENIKDLGWKPKVGMKEGIMKTLQSLDYSPNTNAFKPAIYIDKKVKKEEENIYPDSIVSLQGVKITSRPKEASIQDVPESKDIPPKVDKSTTDKPAFEKKKRVFKGFSFGNVRILSSVSAILLSAFLVFICIPVISTYYNVSKGVSSLNLAKDSLVTMDSEKLEKNTTKAYEYFRQGRMSLRKLRWLFSFSGKDSEYSSYDKLLGSLSLFSRAGSLGSGAVKPIESVFETIRPDNSDVLDPAVFEDAKSSISGMKDYVGMARADLLGVDEKHVPKKYKDRFYEFKKFLEDYQNISDNLYTVMSGLPQILGMSGEKKYIVWFQNSNELRPTGGFIGSYALIKLDNGKIKNIFIDDIYNPDGQIDVRNIKTEVPTPIKGFLGEETLYLRNSNWDPDFSKSVRTFDDIYFKIKGETIDGYIAVDLQFAESLLRVTGPVFLSSYNEDITAENLDERAQYYSGFDYKDGSQDKKSFLAVLGGKMLESIFSLDKKDMSKLSEEVVKSLNQRHLQVYFANNPINAILKEKMWDGSLVDTDGDYLMVVNANLGGTKSNYYVENSMNYEVSSLTRDGVLRATLTLEYKNNSETDAWPGGPYKDYVRVLSQSGAKLTGADITFNNGTKEDIFKDVVTSNVGKYTSFETSFVLNPKDTVKLVLGYDLSPNVSLSKDNGAYTLRWQKQAGTDGDNVSFSFNPPFGSMLNGSSSNLEITDTSLKYSGKFNSDLDFYINLR